MVRPGGSAAGVVAGARGMTQDGALLRAYREHGRELLSFLARRLRCLATAGDLVQDLYLRLP